MPSKLQNDWQRCRYEQNTVKKYVDSLIEKQLITAEPTSVYTQKAKSVTAICSIPFAR